MTQPEPEPRTEWYKDPDDSWKTPELIAAEQAADQVLRDADQVFAEAQALQFDPPGDPAAPENVAGIRAAAEARDAPPELRALKQKVDRGELTWEGVLRGEADSDPDVRAAMESRLQQAREMFQAFEEGATLEDLLEAHGYTMDDVNRASAPPEQESPGDDDDDFDEGFSPFDNNNR